LIVRWRGASLHRCAGERGACLFARRGRAHRAPSADEAGRFLRLRGATEKKLPESCTRVSRSRFLPSKALARNVSRPLGQGVASLGLRQGGGVTCAARPGRVERAGTDAYRRAGASGSTCLLPAVAGALPRPDGRGRGDRALRAATRRQHRWAGKRGQRASSSSEACCDAREFEAPGAEVARAREIFDELGQLRTRTRRGVCAAVVGGAIEVSAGDW